MEIDVQTTRQSVRPLHGLWKAGEAPRAAKPGDCAQKLRKLCATMKRMMRSSTTRLVEAKRRPRPSRAKTMVHQPRSAEKVRQMWCKCGARRPWTRHEGPISAPRTAVTWTFFGADDGIRTRDPHLGKVIWHNSVTSHFIHSSMFCWALDLPLLATMYRYWPRLVRFSWYVYHEFLYHMHHGQLCRCRRATTDYGP